MGCRHVDRYHSHFGCLNSLVVLIECNTRGKLARLRRTENSDWVRLLSLVKSVPRIRLDSAFRGLQMLPDQET